MIKAILACDKRGGVVRRGQYLGQKTQKTLVGLKKTPQTTWL